MNAETTGTITVESPDLKLGHSLQEFAATKVQALIKRHFQTLISATVHLRQQRESFVCTIHMVTGSGARTPFAAEGSGKDCYAAVTATLRKLGVQLQRAKEVCHSHEGRRPDKDFDQNLTGRWEPENLGIEA